MHKSDGLEPGNRSGKPPAHRKRRHRLPVDKTRAVQVIAVIAVVVFTILLLINH